MKSLPMVVFTLALFGVYIFLPPLCHALHTNNWAVLVDTSRFWFNYRHAGNILGVYRSIKRLGIPDRFSNHFNGCRSLCTVYQSAYNPIDLYGDDIEVDYRGSEVTVDNFIRVVTGRLPPSAPSSKRLNSDQFSNVLLVTLTRIGLGHGGDGFLKFQDDSELSSDELADVINQMFNQLIHITDTCQAESMGKKIYSPNVITIGSSRIGEDSYSHHLDSTIGVYVADRYSYHALRFFNLNCSSILIYSSICPFSECHSHVAARTDLFPRNPKEVLVTDFFSSNHHIQDGSYLRGKPLNISADTKPLK
ncbi:unnamed protein product [Schistocephalus solidus]|uniref:GPI-anchor transamidase n=1 Tax=Schistocephalus solidus TaxID=70667 RepID=A0A183SF15_SCHSO|nr:unnamed protein product [Schistocephalus solidus]